MWEIPALAIINELRSRAAMKDYGPFTLDVLYARAKAKMWEKVERLKRFPTSASPISARGGGIPSCGSAGASRR